MALSSNARESAIKVNEGWLVAREVQATFVQIAFVAVGDDLRLRRLTCGKALPFRKTPDLNNLLLAGWKAKPSSLQAEGQGARHWPESRRLSASRGGRAALSVGVSWQFGQP
jgi:hypothetical protein